MGILRGGVGDCRITTSQTKGDVVILDVTLVLGCKVEEVGSVDVTWVVVAVVAQRVV